MLILIGLGECESTALDVANELHNNKRCVIECWLTYYAVNKSAVWLLCARNEA